jgi:hypothetical protein
MCFPRSCWNVSLLHVNAISLGQLNVFHPVLLKRFTFRWFLWMCFTGSFGHIAVVHMNAFLTGSFGHFAVVHMNAFQSFFWIRFVGSFECSNRSPLLHLNVFVHFITFRWSYECGPIVYRTQSMRSNRSFDRFQWCTWMHFTKEPLKRIQMKQIG